MQDVTLGFIGENLKFIIELVAAVITVYAATKRAVNKALEPLNKKIDEVEMKGVENFLVQEISNMKRSGIKLDEVAAKYFYDQYDIYVAKGHNSYIKHEVQECQNRGLI